jgi:hypothetical protein
MDLSPSSPLPDDAAHAAVLARFDAILVEMVEIGAALMRRLETAATGDAKSLKATVGLYDVLLKSMRRCMMLAVRLGQPEAARRKPPAPPAQAGADAGAGAGAAKKPAAERAERPDAPDRLDRLDELPDGPIGEGIATICRDMSQVCQAMGQPAATQRLTDLAAMATQAAVDAVLKETPKPPDAAPPPRRTGETDGTTARYGTSRFRARLFGTTRFAGGVGWASSPPTQPRVDGVGWASSPPTQACVDAVGWASSPPTQPRNRP